MVIEFFLYLNFLYFLKFNANIFSFLQYIMIVNCMSPDSMSKVNTSYF
jgi:hypothetical protein